MFDNFTSREFDGEGQVPIFARVSQPDRSVAEAVVLIHGYPQTSAVWHRIAPVLAQDRLVICPDLRGYGRSGKPAGAADHANYSKRTMARDIVSVLDQLGVESAAIVGHDRGARVGHRLTLDHPERVTRLSLIDIAPTLFMHQRMTAPIASAYFHWSFLTQPVGVPETLLRGQERQWARGLLTGFGHARFTAFDPAAQEEYEEAFQEPGCLHATCEDYRAGASIDLRHDEQTFDEGTLIDCPTQVIWGDKGVMARHFRPRDVWDDYVTASIDAITIAAGHFIPDEAPQLLATHLARFISAAPHGLH